MAISRGRGDPMPRPDASETELWPYSRLSAVLPPSALAAYYDILGAFTWFYRVSFCVPP